MKNAIYNSSYILWSVMISFLISPLMIYYLGDEKYGMLIMIWSLTGILGVMSLGLGEGTLRYVAYYKGLNDLAGINRVFGSTLSFYLIASVVVSLIFLTNTSAIVTLFKIADGKRLNFEILLRLSTIIFSLNLITSSFMVVPMALQRYDISTKVNIGQSIVRSIGYILLIIFENELIYIVLWDVLISLCVLGVQISIVKIVFPGLRLMPSFQFRGLREIFKYSFFSSLTYIFFKMHRESGVLSIGMFIGPAPVAYFATPDNVSQRVHNYIASAFETLMPKFSTNRDINYAKYLFKNGTWGSLAISLTLLIPIAVLIPDFLRLWINEDFAQKSAAVGQLVVLSYISQGAFAPPATYFRGTSKPWFVTIFIALAGIITLMTSVIMISSYGVIGVGYAYVIGSLAHLFGTFIGWRYLFGSFFSMMLMRYVGMPLLMGGSAFAIETAIRSCFNELNWFSLFTLGGLFAFMTGVLISGLDLVVAGDSPSKTFLTRIGRSQKLRGIIKVIGIKKVGMFSKKER